MADEADLAQKQMDEENTRTAAAFSAAVAAIPEGEAGECVRCGEESARLVIGACARCRDKYKLP